MNKAERRMLSGLGNQLVDVANGAIAKRDIGAEVTEIDHYYDMAYPDGAVQYAVEVTLSTGTKRYMLIRIYGTQQSADVTEDYNFVSFTVWPPRKVKVVNSTFEIKSPEK